jgi:uncharacterized protein with FMN-binding domain
MRKGLLIGVGTLGGLGAVLSITPPQFTNSKLATSGVIPASNPAPVATNSATPAPVQTQAAATPSATTTKKTSKKKKTTKSSTSSTSANTTATKNTQAPAATKAAAPAQTQEATSGTSGTFVGTTSQTRFGPVQVQITVENGKITAAKALQSPNGDFRSSSISSQAIPYLIQETLAAQSSNIQGVGGASYTSYGWYQSLQSALAKAGMK